MTRDLNHQAVADLRAVVLSGALGAGKTESAHYLAERYGLEHLSFVERIFIPRIRTEGRPINRANLQRLGIELISDPGPEALVEVLLATRQLNNVVLDDVRRADVLSLIRARCRKLVHVHIVASFAVRFPRLVSRDGIKNEEEQREAESVETETGIAELEFIADHVITNTGSFADLETKLDQALAGFLPVK